jgi:hypothetical protein
MTSDEISEKHEFSVSMFRGRERVVSALRWQMSSDQVYSISLDGPDGPDGPVAGGGSDLFQALQEIRLEVEPQGWLLAVQGARKDTYASGMVRDMLGARRVYVIQAGRQAERAHLVDIFAEAAVESLGTVEQQKAFYREWRRSLKR